MTWGLCGSPVVGGTVIIVACLSTRRTCAGHEWLTLLVASAETRRVIGLALRAPVIARDALGARCVRGRRRCGTVGCPHWLILEKTVGSAFESRVALLTPRHAGKPIRCAGGRRD